MAQFFLRTKRETGESPLYTKIRRNGMQMYIPMRSSQSPPATTSGRAFQRIKLKPPSGTPWQPNRITPMHNTTSDAATKSAPESRRTTQPPSNGYSAPPTWSILLRRTSWRGATGKDSARHRISPRPPNGSTGPPIKAWAMR